MTRGHLLLVTAAILAGFVWAGVVVSQRLADVVRVDELSRCRAAAAAWRDAGCTAAWRAARERFLKAPVS